MDGLSIMEKDNVDESELLDGESDDVEGSHDVVNSSGKPAGSSVVSADARAFMEKMDSMVTDNQGSPLDKVYERLIGMMHDPKHVLSFGVFTAEMQFYAMKAVIIRDWFVKFFMNIDVKVVLEPSNVYPYYVRVVKVITPKDFENIMRDSYWATMSDMFMTSVAVDGKGRDQGVDILGGTKNEIEEDERNALKYMRDKVGV